MGASSSGTSQSLKSSYSSSFKWGSSGSALRTWMWLLLIGLCCLCCAGGAGGAAMASKKPKKKKTAPKPAPAPEPEPVPEVPLLAPMMPVATTSALIPSYSMTGGYPATTAYAAPATTAYAAPATTAYATPAYGGYGGYPGVQV